MQLVRSVLTIDGVAREYEFRIDRKQNPPVLHIPGDHRGPDLCIPQRPEQEKWLDSLGEVLIPYWHCQWKFLSGKACEDFIVYLNSIEIPVLKKPSSF